MKLEIDQIDSPKLEMTCYEGSGRTPATGVMVQHVVDFGRARRDCRSPTIH